MFKRSIAALTLVSVTGMSLPLAALANGLVETTEVQTVQRDAVQARIQGLLVREDVAQALRDRGVNPAMIEQRVAAMTDEEAQQVAARLDQLPAGGDVLGVLFAVFIILLVTDILGLTKVFPFTRSVR